MPFRTAALLLLFSVFSAAAHAQAWPTRPLKIIVPFAPGGSTDLTARLLAPRMQEALGQPVVVENKAGAGGAIATDFVAKSAPDGNTMLIAVAGPFVIAPLIAKAPYDPLKDFAFVAGLNGNPQVLLANPAMPAKTIRELIALAKAQPRALNFGTAGPGSLIELSGLVFNHMAGTSITTVPYKGGAPAVAAAIGGEVQLTFANTSDALPQVKSGKLRAMAVTSAARFPQLPDVPSIAESGLPDFNVVTWNAMVTPAGTPPEVVNRLARVIQDTLKDPAVRQRMSDFGTTTSTEGPAELGAFVQAQYAFWQKFIKESGLKTGN
ncbi:MAG: tripartite tricarboxylate transporter substrate binding protein [Proteobacteria bacterium]|nr:tripartite tricarboxylate transporter substrate binding protein [Pseudomonadota bacterium]